MSLPANGMKALMLLLNYSFTGSQDHDIDENRSKNSEGANLRPGINIGAWRFRNYSQPES